MTDDDLDHLLDTEQSSRPPGPTWPLAVAAFVAIVAVLMWVTAELVQWWISAVYCGWFLC